MDSMRCFMIAGAMIGGGVGAWRNISHGDGFFDFPQFVLIGGTIGAGCGSLLWQFA